MTATGHALIAALIAGKLNNPVEIVALSFVSHFACDLVPHWDFGIGYKKKTREKIFFEAALDVIVGLVLSTLLYNQILGQSNFLYLYLAVFAAQLPDWVSSIYFIFKIKFPLFVWVHNLQIKFNHSLNSVVGVLTQIASVIVIYILLYKIF